MKYLKKVVTTVLLFLFGVCALVTADEAETQFDSVVVPYTAKQTSGENFRVAAKVMSRWVMSHRRYEWR